MFKKIPPFIVILTLITIMKLTLPFISTFNFSQSLINVASGFVFLSASIFIALGFTKQLRMRSWQNILWATKRPVLIIDGVYSVTRNPLYLGLVLLVGAFGLYWQHSWFIVYVFISVYLIQRFYVVPEEHELSQRYSVEFSVYCTRVSRWF